MKAAGITKIDVHCEFSITDCYKRNPINTKRSTLHEV